MHFLAETGALPGVMANGSGFNIWQSLGGLAVVFGLLLLCLKLLGRFNRQRAGGQAAMLTVWPLGPKREIQVLRLEDEVHYIYKHDGAMVLLKQESFAAWERSRAQESPSASVPTKMGGLLQAIKP